MAAVVGASSERVLVLQFEDFRGQVLNKRYELHGATTDAQIATLVDEYDAVTNARFTKAFVEDIKPITGTKAVALNALERNISEQMELAFEAVDVVTGRTVTKTVIVPSMIAAIENLDGFPSVVNAPLNAFTDDLQTRLTFEKADHTIFGGTMLYNPAESHHITVSDIVDTR